MLQKSEADVQRAATAKAVRTAIRLKHSLKADEEINEVLPMILEQFDRALSRGQSFVFDVRTVFDEVTE